MSIRACLVEGINIKEMEMELFPLFGNTEKNKHGEIPILEKIIYL